jgi:hypothetical protein
VPASPSHHIMKGDKIKAGEVLMWLRGTKNLEDVNEELFAVKMAAILLKLEILKLKFIVLDLLFNC